MINEIFVKRCCCEDPSLIENYEQAIADKSQTWHCHHRKETDEGLSRSELIKMGLYWKRPACELIFLTQSEHMSLHRKCNQFAENNPFYGKHHTEDTKEKLRKPRSSETKAKMSAAKKGKHLSVEHRANISAANKGKFIGEKNPMAGRTGAKNPRAKAVYQIDKNTDVIIKKWACIKEASKTLGISAISACCKGKRKSAGGFKWRYVE